MFVSFYLGKESLKYIATVVIDETKSFQYIIYYTLWATYLICILEMSNITKTL